MEWIKGKRGLNDKEKEANRKEKHGNSKICYCYNLKKCEVIKRREEVMTKVILKVDQIGFTASKHNISAVVLRKSWQADKNSRTRHTSQ